MATEAPLSALLTWTTEIYTLKGGGPVGGMIMAELAVELARGDSGPEARDEVLVLVLWLNLSRDSGKSLRFFFLICGVGIHASLTLSHSCRYCL